MDVIVENFTSILRTFAEYLLEACITQCDIKVFFGAIRQSMEYETQLDHCAAPLEKSQI
jgi:hypothetical protein